MPFEGLLAHFGVSSYAGVLGALQPALGEAYAGEAADILASGDEAAAALFVDQVVRGQTPTELLDLMRKSGAGAGSAIAGARRFEAAQGAEGVQSGKSFFILRGDRSFVELIIDLQQHFDNKDFEAAVIVMEEAAVVSRGVARLLRAELCSSHEGKRKKSAVLVTQLAQLLLDPSLKKFPTITDHPSLEEALRFQSRVERRDWTIVEMFGRITILTAEEFQNFLLGKMGGIFHPSVRIISAEELQKSPFFHPASSQALPSGERSLRGPAALVPSPLAAVPGFPVAPFPGFEGAMILVGRQIPAKTQNPNIPYALLRSVVYLHLAYGTESHFKEAAALVENISDPYLLARFFDDLRMGVGAEKNGFKNAARFFSDTSAYVGRMFAAISPETVAGIIFILHQHARWHDQKALDQWLLLAFKALHRRDASEEESPSAHLPKLSVILGTLIEWERTREMARRMLEEGLDLLHEASGEISNAMEKLHESHPEFAEPMAFAAGNYQKIYDERRARQELDLPPTPGLRERALAAVGIHTPRARVFSPPPETLAGREIVFGRLRGELMEAVGESGEERGASALAERILFSLPPVDVWRLAKAVGEVKEISPFGLLAAMLLNQPTEVLAAFFSAWGHGLVEDEELNPLGRTLMELWRRGDFGERLVTDLVDRALEDDAAVAVLQKVLSQSGTDGEWMIAQIEIYLELASLLGAKINPYEVFATTRVLRPGDLSGKFRQQAIGRAMKIMNDIDKYGRFNVGTKLEMTDYGSSGEMMGRGAKDVPDPESGQELTADEQTLWRRRLTGLLVQLRADEPAVVNYFAARLESENEAKAKEAFAILDRLGPRAQKILVAHIRRQATLKIPQRLPSAPLAGALKHLDVSTHEMVEVPISLRDLLKRFPFTSRAMQVYILGRLEKLEEADFKNTIQELVEAVGEAALIFIDPEVFSNLCKEVDRMKSGLFHLVEDFLTERRGIFIVRKKMYGAGPVRDIFDLPPEVSSLFVALISSIPELVGNEAAHQKLFDLYHFVKKFEYENNTYPQHIIRALARMEHKAGYAGPWFLANLWNNNKEKRTLFSQDPKNMRFIAHAVRASGEEGINMVAEEVQRRLSQEPSFEELYRNIYHRPPLKYSPPPATMISPIDRIVPANETLKDSVRESSIQQIFHEYLHLLVWMSQLYSDTLSSEQRQIHEEGMKILKWCRLILNRLVSEGLAQRFARPEDLALFREWNWPL